MGHEEEQEGVGGVGRGRGRGGAGVSIPSGLGYGRQRGGSSGTLNAMCCKTCAVPLTVSYLLPVSTYIPKVEHGDGRSEEATLSPLGSTETWRFGGKDGTSCVREARGGMMGRGQNAPSWALPRQRVAGENRPQVPRSVGRRSKLLPKASATPSPRPGRAHAPAARSLAQACFSSPKTESSLFFGSTRTSRGAYQPASFLGEAMPAVLFWGTGARGSGTVPEVLGHETGTRHSPTCRLRVALEDFLSPASRKQRLSNPTRGVEIPVFTRRMR